MKSAPCLAVVLSAFLQPALIAQNLPEHALVRIGDSRFHGGGHRMRFAPDGKTLAVAKGGKIRLLDSATGADRLILEHLSKSTPKSTELTPNDIIEMVFFADSKTLVTADVPGVIRTWSLPDGKEIRLLQTHPGVATLCVAADERSVFTAGFDGILRELELPGGKEKQRWTTPGKQPILAIATLGKQVVAVSKDGSLHTWDPQTGKPTRQVELGPVLLGAGLDFGTRVFPSKGSTSFATFVRGVEFSHDGRRLAQHKGQQIWDVESGKVIANLPDPKKTSVRLAFSPDGKSVAAAPIVVKQSVRLFASASGDELGSLDSGPVTAVAIAPDGQTVAFAANNRIRLWQHATKEVLGGGDAIGIIRDWDLSADGKQVAFVTQEKDLRLYDLQTGKHQETVATEGTIPGLVRFHPDGRKLIVGHSNIGLVHYEKQAAGWQVVKSIPMKQQQLMDFRGPGPFVPFGNKTTRLVDMVTGNPQGGLKQQNKYTNFNYSPDGRHLIVDVELPLKQPTTGFGRVLVGPREFQLFALPTMTMLRSIKQPARVLYAQWQFSPDGRLALLETDPVRVFELLTGRERMTVRVPFVTAGLHFAPDGKSLLTGTTSGDLVVLSLPGGTELYRVKAAHGARVKELAISRQRQLVSVGADHTLVMWSADLWKGRAAVKPLKLDSEDLDLFFQHLEANDGANIASAITSMIAGGDVTVGYLKAKLGKGFAKADSAAQLRGHRSVEILEHIGSPAAREVLNALATGNPDAPIAIDAKQSLVRLSAP